jgi:hypothetical protein
VAFSHGDSPLDNVPWTILESGLVYRCEGGLQSRAVRQHIDDTWKWKVLNAVTSDRRRRQLAGLEQLARGQAQAAGSVEDLALDRAAWRHLVSKSEAPLDDLRALSILQQALALPMP